MTPKQLGKEVTPSPSSEDEGRTKVLLEAAQRGEVDAQSSLGDRFLDGIGALKDIDAGLSWYRLAADQGDPHAQYRVGHCFLNGVGVAADKGEAVKWFRLAAEKTYPEALRILGVYYRSDLGKDPIEAEKWYRLAVKAGYPGAAADLEQLVTSKDYKDHLNYEGHNFSHGEKYEEGKGVPQDLAEAAKWYSLAAESTAPVFPWTPIWGQSPERCQ